MLNKNLNTIYNKKENQNDDVDDVIEELSAMAVVVFENSILSTNEEIYGNNTLSLPKGHKENNEAILETAIRECYEETNILLNKDDCIKQLTPFTYEFITPSYKKIRKTIVPFLFETNNPGIPFPKEKRMISVQWMNINYFYQNCTHDNVKNVIKEIIDKYI